MHRIIRSSCLILILLAALAATLEIAVNVYDRLPRLEDELAYYYQAQVFASGRLYAATPVEPESFRVPFVVDLDGKRFSKYPPGGSIPILIGLWVGDPWLIGPLVGVLALAVTYRLARDLFDEWTALVALAIGAISPFFLVLTPSFMAHSASMLASAIFGLLFARLRKSAAPSAGLAASAGLALGLAVLIRPYTTVWLAAPFAVLALYDSRASWRTSLNRYGPLIAGFLLLAILLLLYNFILSGQWRLSLYDLWWPWDRIGFGPDIGPRGFTPLDSLRKMYSDLYNLTNDLHGVPFLSLLPGLLGLLLPRRSRIDVFLLTIFVSLMVGALFYHSGSRLYGPRYFYEAWPALILLSARGLVKAFRWAARWPLARILYFIFTGLYFGITLAFYIPFRLNLLHTIHQGALNWAVRDAVQQANLHQALVFQFADDWPEAAAGTLLTDPDLEADVIYARYLGPDLYRAAAAAFPERAIYFWRAGQLQPAFNPPPEWYPEFPTVRDPDP